jgi:hypothetical protein
VLILPVPLGAFQPRKPAPNERLANKVTSSQDDGSVDTEEVAPPTTVKYGDLYLQRNCHPEPRGVEEPVPSAAEGTPAVPILPRAVWSFSTTKARTERGVSQ